MSAVAEKVALDASDLARLMADPSAENRRITVSKLGRHFSGGGLAGREKSLAEDIFRTLARDVSVSVRSALSDSLKDSVALPHDIALSLARDVDEVALPIIESSSVLSDEDLLEIVATNKQERQIAVARRQVVSAVVADALADTHNEEVVATLVANEGADLRPETMSKVLDEFGSSPRVNEPMARRQVLPLVIAERLVGLVSERLREHLVTHHELSPDVAADLLLQSRERATAALLSSASRLDVAELVGELFRNGRLTPTLIVRALCTGDTNFFETALARLSNIPVASAYRLIHDRGGRGLKALYDRCNMPESLFPLVTTAIRVAQETEMLPGGDADREHFRALMIERVVTNFESGYDGTNIDYLIAKLGSGSPGQATAGRAATS
ncbi:DUF2336 domain-containing protein [Zavarzinia sp. CC-PAN008]|uniref:DUF2336 domain-containing protein n=1 Tax=Zavarzinia sp. CC-PAN008 TaxID=3243332 RepID=UPI003F742A1F